MYKKDTRTRNRECCFSKTYLECFYHNSRFTKYFWVTL